MLESKIQSKIIRDYETKGYFVIKLIATNKIGIPDLLVMRGNESFFVEVKSENGKLSEIQKYRIQELEKFNIKVYVQRDI